MCETKYTKEIEKTIIDNYSNMSSTELCDLLKSRHNFETSVMSLKSKLKRMRKMQKIGRKHAKRHNYSEEENKWLIEQTKNYNYINLHKLFNEKFGAEVNAQALQFHCLNKLNIRISNTQKGDYHSILAKNIGSERWDDGYWWVKVNDSRNGKRKNWKQKHRYIWEQYYGAIPKGHRVIFLDGNKNNFDINNLACVDINAQTSIRHVPSGCPHLVSCKIKTLELNKVLNKLKEEFDG